MSGPSHIGLNLLYLVPGRVGGTETYARELVRALATARPDVRFTAFAASEAHAALTAVWWPDNVAFERIAVRAASRPARIVAELAALPVLDARAGVDVLHSFGTTSPPLTRSVRIVTVHDLIYAHFPKAFSLPARVALKALVPLGARRADRVIVLSESAKADVVAGLRLNPDLVDVVPNGMGMAEPASVASETELRSRYGLGKARVVLTVASALPHKNLDRLLSALARLEGFSDDAAPVLTVVGHAGRLQRRLRAHAQRLAIADRVRFTGWLPDRDLEGLYRLAACFAYPSLAEGFGLPVLEAMRRGVPVACSNASSLPEVAGGAAELFDPEDVAAIAGALRRVLRDDELRRTLVERGRARAARFTWEQTARATFASYERAWRRRRGR